MIKKQNEQLKHIALDPTASINYALSQNSRFEMGEKSISTQSNLSVLYAKSILRGRFRKGEPAISKSSYYVCAYLSDVLNCFVGKKLPNKMHNIMLSKAIEDTDDHWTIQYFKYCSYLEGKLEKPYWIGQASNRSIVNWDYRI